MLCSFSVNTLPQIEAVYIVVRRTVWQVADPYNILLVVLDGACRVDMGGTGYELCAGSALLIPAAQSYRRTPVGEGMCRMMYIHFTAAQKLRELETEEAAEELRKRRAETEAALLENRKNSLFAVPPLYLPNCFRDPDGSLLAIAAEMEALLGRLASDNALPLTLHFCRMLALISRESCRALRDRETDTELRRVPSALKKAVWFIRQNYAQKITLDDLCAVSNLSKSQLIRSFKESLGKTPTQYLIEFRINRTREILLNAPEMSLKNICVAAGFDDPHYFSRVFVKVTGETPSAYRYRVTHFGAVEQDKG